jgi:hypothetical protein
MSHGEISTVSEEDSKGGPQLPGHDQSTTDGGRRVLCRKNRDCRTLCTHSESEQETADEELPPCLGESRANDGEEAEDGGNEDCATTAQIEVQGVGQPAANEGGTDIGTRVNKTEEQSIVDAGASDAKERRHRQVGTVGTGLIPSLDSCTDGASDDGEV